MMSVLYQPVAPFPQKEYKEGVLPDGVKGYSEIIAAELASASNNQKTGVIHD
jgi:hypothetical protein